MVIPPQGSVPLPSHHRLQMQTTDWMRRRSAAWNGYNTRKSIHPSIHPSRRPSKASTDVD
ncbi:hypothetical protein LY76DRAFT_594774, partial [Colletotrichum caudatum]